MSARHLARVVLAAMTACIPAGSVAQSPAASPNATDAGAALAARGAEGVAPCASCHGAAGEGNAQAGFPRLAGQPAYYLRRQLDAFANGKRDNPVMSPIAKAMNEEQRAATAGYYAGLTSRAPATATAAPKNVAPRARLLANVGDDAKGIQACANCHGPDGRGEPPSYPYLAGLSQQYLTAALQEWKSGARDSDPSAQMRTIGRRLSDDDIALLARYFAALPAPAPLADVQPARAGASSPSTSGPPAQPVQGVGTEQGTLTGGSQGPGGGGAASGSGPAGSTSGGAQTK